MDGTELDTTGYLVLIGANTVTDIVVINGPPSLVLGLSVILLPGTKTEFISRTIDKTNEVDQKQTAEVLPEKLRTKSQLNLGDENVDKSTLLLK
jgi:hypothetical protein